MRFAFKQLPGARDDYRRPIVPVTVEGLPRAPQSCLLDSGSLHNRFGAWIATAAGIDLADADHDRVTVGGFVADAWVSRVALTIGDVTWDAPVWFCEPWPLSFHLLGQEGFFRWFTVRFRTGRYTIDVAPEA